MADKILRLTEGEQNALLQLLDQAVRHGGLASSRAASHFVTLLESAEPAPAHPVESPANASGQ